MGVEAIWSYLGTGATLAQAREYSDETHKVHGLAQALTVANFARDAGTVHQTITESNGVVTVERQP